MTTPNPSGGVELTNISTPDNNDDDYFNAIMGRDTYTPPATNTHTTTDDYQDAATPTNKLSKPMKQSGIFGASANLVNSIVGAGIIGIPYALNQSGLTAGVFLLILVAYLTDKSLRIIVGLASFHPQLKFRDVRTFEDLASYPFGNLGSNFILVNMFVMAYGAMVAYLLIIKDTIPHILGVDADARLERTLIMIVTSLTVMVPLAMQRDMASLSLTSVFSIIADVILVIFIAAYSPIQETVANAGGFGQVILNDSIEPTLFIGLGILSTAMACQHSAFIVSGSLEHKTMTRWSKVTGGSITISAILCLILGICGYLGFLEETEGDVLNNFAQDEFLPNGARFLLATTMFFTYPMESFVARHVIIQLMHEGDMDGKDDPNHSGVDGDEAGGFWFFNRRQSWTIGIYLLTLFPALLVDDVGPVLSFTGSLGGGCIAYMAPGLCYLAVNGGEFLLFANNLLNKGKQPSGNSDVTEADLPVDGNANQVIITHSSNPATVEIDSGAKPIWWYIAGFPIWCKVATVGRMNMTARIQQEQEVSPSPQDVNEEDILIPNTTEFCIAICFVIFGVVAVIAGVGSNVYVQAQAIE